MRISDWSSDVCSSDLFGARFHRWTDLGEQVAIRRGVWKPQTTLLPHASVQSVDLKTDFLLRPLGLATLVFGVPGGSSLAAHDIPAIPVDDAQALRTRILAARTRRCWTPPPDWLWASSTRSPATPAHKTKR